MQTLCSSSESLVFLPVLAEPSLNEHVNSTMYYRSGECDGKLDTFCMRRLFAEAKEADKAHTGVDLLRDQRVEEKVAGDYLFYRSGPKESLSTSSTGPANYAPMQAERSINYTLNSISSQESKRSSPLPLGIPLPRPPKLATVSHVIASACLSSFGKRKHDDEVSSSAGIIRCESKIYDAKTHSNLAIPGLNAYSKKMAPDERGALFSLSTESATKKLRRLTGVMPRPIDSSDVRNSNPLGPPPFVLLIGEIKVSQ